MIAIKGASAQQEVVDAEVDLKRWQVAAHRGSRLDDDRETGRRATVIVVRQGSTRQVGLDEGRRR